MQHQLVALFTVATSTCCFFLVCRQRRQLCTVTQALPEWRRQNTQQDGKQTKPRASLTSTTLKTYDHAGPPVGLGFASFHGQNKCAALQAPEIRFAVPSRRYLKLCKGKLLVARCAAAFRIRTLAPRAFKWCGARRDEYWSMSRILAPSASPRCFFLFAHCKIRSCHFLDPLHRLHDDHNNAMTASGLTSMKTERVIVSNHKNGSWKQAGNLRRLQDAAREYFSSTNCQ